MQKLWLHCVRGYLKLGMFFYFKKIEVYNADNIPKNESVLVLCNHQNALLDPLIIATEGNRFFHFLTRAGVFKKSFVNKLLRTLQMLPVYRVRDGWSNISKNNSIFATCSELLKNEQAVVIFPEGSHNLVRRVRPLSKGFTRIVFETLEKYPNTDLKLLPVGLNYIKLKEFGDSVSIYFGKPLNAKDYIENFDNDDVVKLKNAVHGEISKLTTHIPSETYDETLSYLEMLNVDFLNPKGVNACIESNFNECHPKSSSNLNGLRSFFKFLLKVVLLGPFLVWSKLLKPKVKELEFLSTFRYAVALTLVPLWLIVIGIILSLIFGWMIGVGFVAGVLIIDLLAIKL